MTPLKLCLNHWIEIREARKQDIKNTIKELEILEDTKPFNHHQWEVEMSNLRRYRHNKECTDWFVTSLTRYEKLENENMEEFDFNKKLEKLINIHSMENESNTPDFILAKFMLECLQSFNNAVKHREQFKTNQ